MAKPEVQALIATEQKANLEARFAALFRNLNLPPEQLEKLKTLLIDRQNVVQDVMGAARDQGIDPRENREAFSKMVADARASVNDNLKSLLGESGYNQLATYEQTMPQRNLVGVLQQRLSYSDTPLTASQADQLVQVLAANPANTSTAGNGSRGGDFGGMGVRFGGGMGATTAIGPNAPAITSAAINQAQGILNQTQLAALQKLQQQQQAAKQLEQVMRSAVQPSNTGTSGNTANGSSRRRGGG